jgi:hypothetical protein
VAAAVVESGAHLWLATTGAADDPVWAQAFVRHLSSSEEARLRRFARPQRRTQFLAAHALVRMAIAARSGCTADAVHVAQDDDGRPRIDAPATQRVSLAHSGQWAAALVDADAAGKPLGVDIELCEAERDIEAIVGVIGVHAASRADAYRQWVCFEATQKAPGAEHVWVALCNELALGVAGIARPPAVWQVELSRFGDSDVRAKPLTLEWSAGSVESAYG